MYGEYMRFQNMGTAAGQGLPYELFSGDIKEVSDRTLRVIINEFRRFAEQRQWQIIIPMMCQPVVEWFARAAALVGKVQAAEVEMIRRCEHAPHGWAHIHPVQDPQGKKLEVDAGFRSRSSVIAERGDDPDQVDDEREADNKRAIEKGLAMDPAEMQQGGKQGDDDGIDNEEYSAPPNASPPNAMESASINLARAQANALNAVASKARAKPEAHQMTEAERQSLELTQSILAMLKGGDGE